MKKKIVVGLLLVIVIIAMCSCTKEAKKEAGNVLVPELKGLTLEQAKEAITEAKLSIGDILYEKNIEVAENTVLEQSPASNTSVEEGTAIEITVSKKENQ